ncbi:MAG: DUF2946 domain-containing protein [Halopseudomonas sp.]
MTIARNQRFAITMMLYVSTLFSVLTFGFHQSQMSGQHLGGVDAVYCGSGNVIPDFDPGDQSPPVPASDHQPACPVCSSLGHGSALTSLNWSVDYPPANPAAPQVSYNWVKPAPRYSWPTLNPRAPPAAFLATGLFS